MPTDMVNKAVKTKKSDDPYKPSFYKIYLFLTNCCDLKILLTYCSSPGRRWFQPHTKYIDY